MAAETFDVAGDLADAAALGSLEEHVLVEMCEPLLAGSLVCGTDTGPDLELDHRRTVTLAEQEGEAVGKDAMGRCRLSQSAARVTEAPSRRPREAVSG